MESTGFLNANGDTVLRAAPSNIRLLHSQEVLHFEMRSFMPEQSDVLSVHGVYHGQDGIPRFSGEWLVRNPDKWEAVP